MKERTEEDKIAQAGLQVILGGRAFEVRPLVIRDSREWRKKAIALVAPLPGYTNITTDDMESFEAALTALLVTMPDQCIDLFFEYAKDLDPKEVEGIATDAEMAEAFEQVLEIAFPLAQSAPEMLKRLRAEPEEVKKPRKTTRSP